MSAADKAIREALETALSEPGGFQRAMAEQLLEQALDPECGPDRPIRAAIGIGWAILAVAEKLSPSAPMSMPEVEP